MSRAYFVLAAASLGFAAVLLVSVLDKQEALDLETFAKVGGTLGSMAGTTGLGAFLRGWMAKPPQ